MRRRLTAVLSVVAVGVVMSALAGPAAADPAPDLSLTALNPNDPHVQRGQDFTITFEVSGTAADATLTVVVPTETVLRTATDRAAGTAVACSANVGTVTCALGAITDFTNVDMVFRLRADAPIGAEPSITGTISSTAGPDVEPQDDSYTTGITVAGHSVLTHAASVDPLLFPVGGGVAAVTFTVTNTGPDPADSVAMQFTIQSNDTPAPTFAAFSQPVVTPLPGTPQWRLGPLAVGASASITVSVAAPADLADSELSYATSFAGGTVCDNRACLDGVALRIGAAASPSPVTPTPVAGTGRGPATASRPGLAATGSDDGRLTALAAVLVLVGAGLVAAGRGRRRV